MVDKKKSMDYHLSLLFRALNVISILLVRLTYLLLIVWYTRWSGRVLTDWKESKQKYRKKLRKIKFPCLLRRQSLQNDISEFPKIQRARGGKGGMEYPRLMPPSADGRRRRRRLLRRCRLRFVYAIFSACAPALCTSPLLRFAGLSLRSLNLPPLLPLSSLAPTATLTLLLLRATRLPPLSHSVMLFVRLLLLLSLRRPTCRSFPYTLGTYNDVGRTRLAPVVALLAAATPCLCIHASTYISIYIVYICTNRGICDSYTYIYLYNAFTLHVYGIVKPHTVVSETISYRHDRQQREREKETFQRWATQFHTRSFYIYFDAHLYKIKMRGYKRDLFPYVYSMKNDREPRIYIYIFIFRPNIGFDRK